MDFFVTKSKDQNHVSIVIFNSLVKNTCQLPVKFSIEFLCAFIVIIGGKNPTPNYQFKLQNTAFPQHYA